MTLMLLTLTNIALSLRKIFCDINQYGYLYQAISFKNIHHFYYLRDEIKNSVLLDS